MKRLLNFQGQCTRAGFMNVNEVVQLADRPAILIELEDGRTIGLMGLTKEECLACRDAFLEPVSLTVSIPQ